LPDLYKLEASFRFGYDTIKAMDNQRCGCATFISITISVAYVLNEKIVGISFV
jgi:hypothetical protein